MSQLVTLCKHKLSHQNVWWFENVPKEEMLNVPERLTSSLSIQQLLFGQTTIEFLHIAAISVTAGPILGGALFLWCFGKESQIQSHRFLAIASFRDKSSGSSNRSSEVINYYYQYTITKDTSLFSDFFNFLSCLQTRHFKRSEVKETVGRNMKENHITS